MCIPGFVFLEIEISPHLASPWFPVAAPFLTLALLTLLHLRIAPFRPQSLSAYEHGRGRVRMLLPHSKEYNRGLFGRGSQFGVHRKNRFRNQKIRNSYVVACSSAFYCQKLAGWLGGGGFGCRFLGSSSIVLVGDTLRGREAI